MQQNAKSARDAQNFALLNTDRVRELITLQSTCARSQRPLAEALVYWNLGIEYENAGYHKQALKQFELFIKPCHRAGYTPGVLVGMSSIAVSKYLMGDYKGCVQAAEQGAKLVDKALDIIQKTSGGWLSASTIMASFTYNIGLAFLELYDFEAATLAFSRAL